MTAPLPLLQLSVTRQPASDFESFHKILKVLGEETTVRIAKPARALGKLATVQMYSAVDGTMLERVLHI